MGKTVQAVVPYTAGIVNTLTEHAVVLLVGWDLTVALVFVLNKSIFYLLQYI